MRSEPGMMVEGDGASATGAVGGGVGFSAALAGNSFAIELIAVGADSTASEAGFDA